MNSSTFSPFPLTAELREAYVDALARAGREFKFKAVVDPYPKESFDPNAGGIENNQDWSRKKWLAWKLFGDKKAKESAFNKALWHARHVGKFQDAHGHYGDEMFLWGLETEDQALRHELHSAFFNIYRDTCNNLKEAWWDKSGQGYTFRPWLRYVEIATCCAWMMRRALAAGYFKPSDGFPYLTPDEAPEVLAAEASQALQWWFGLRYKDGVSKGWTCDPTDSDSINVLWPMFGEKRNYPAYDSAGEVQRGDETPFMWLALLPHMFFWRRLLVGKKEHPNVLAGQHVISAWAHRTFCKESDWTNALSSTTGPERIKREGTYEASGARGERYHSWIPMLALTYSRALGHSQVERREKILEYMKVMRIEDGNVEEDILTFVDLVMERRTQSGQLAASDELERAFSESADVPETSSMPA